MLEPIAFTSEEMIDLHVHSHFSDGLFSPEEIAKKAADAGLSAIALTDHATVAGVGAMSVAGARHGVHVIPGVELNSAGGDLLGLFVDVHDRRLTAFLESVNAERQNRLRQTLDRLASVSRRIDYNALCRFAAPALPTRCHVTRLLVEQGTVKTVDDAFHRFLGKQGAAYVPGRSPSLASCVKAIRGAGGVAAEAHPHFHHRHRATNMAAHCQTLAALGVAGIEIPRIPPPDLEGFFEETETAARRFSLLRLGGSNFHGPGLTPAALGDDAIGGDRLKALMARLPSCALHADLFKRNFWRWKNLDAGAFANSFDPTTVVLNRLVFTELLELSPLPDSRPVPMPVANPFVLAGPGVVDKGGVICKEIEAAGGHVTAMITSGGYPEIAWRLYGMDRGGLDQKRKDLLRFNLDRHLYGKMAETCRVIFFRPPAGASLRGIKRRIRRRLGPVRFYRLEYGPLVEICMTTHIHMPEETEVNDACRRLHAMGKRFRLM